MLRAIEAINFVIMVLAFSGMDGDAWKECLLLSLICLFVLALCGMGEYLDEYTKEKKNQIQ